MTQARLGWGTLVQYWDGAAYVTVAEAQSIAGPSLSAEDIDVTNHDSSGGFKEFISGLKEGGDVTFNGNLVPEDATHQLIIDDQKTGVRRDWRIVAPDAVGIANRTTIEFVGYVQSCNFEFPTASQMTYSLTLKVAGEPTMSSVFTDNLTALAITTGTLTPAFAAATYEYAATVVTGTTSINVTPTLAGATYTLYVNDAVVASGAPESVNLAVGVNRITVKVTEEDHKSVVYSIVVARASS